MKKYLLLALPIILLSGCGNDTYDKAMEKGERALKNGEFDKSLAMFELALDEKPKDKEAKTYYETLFFYNQVEKSFEEENWDKVITNANELLKEKNIESVMQEELEQFIEVAESNEENQSENVVNTEKTKEEEPTEKKEESTEIKEEQPQNTVPFEPVNEPIKSKKNQYLQKLDDIEKGLSDLDYLYAKGITVEMKQAEYETYVRWDKALNEIYGVLKTQLSASEMNKVKEEQIQWIKDRDNTAELEASEFKGGTFEGVQYLSTQARLTKERCYELVNWYMK